MPDPPAPTHTLDRSTAQVAVDAVERLLTRTRPVGPVPSAEDDPSAIGRYSIRGRLGVGGMGVVFDAHDTTLDRPVALKLMLVDDEAERARLRREAQALARLSHPNVVEVYEIGEHEGRPFVAMELVEGHTLGRWAKLRRRSEAELVEVFAQAGRGLAAAHAQGLVHRDFKPGNVLVGSDGRARVVDFGLVRDSGSAEEDDVSAEGSGSLPAMSSGQAWSEPLTKTGSMVGTPAYMSPEVLSSMPAGPASDQYAFCAALFEALYDQHPFVEDDRWAQLPYNVLEGKRQRPQGPRSRNKALARVVERGLELRPEARWPSMDVLLEHLRATQVRRRPWRGVVVGGLGGLVLVGVMLDSSAETTAAVEPCDRARATMEAVWTVERRDRLREAWREAGSDAGEVWSRVDARVVTYADAWWGAHRGACEGPRSPVEVNAAACLTRLAEGLDAKLDVFATPDDGLATAALQVVGQLEDPVRCQQSRRATAVVDRGTSPHAATLDRIEALYQTGRYEQAAPLIEDLVARTELEGSPQSRAAAMLWLGKLRTMRGEPDQAGEAFEEAHLLAKQSGQDWLAAEAAVALLRLFGEHYYRPAEAELWSGHAQAEVERLGDRVLEASYLNAKGRLLRSQGDLPAALRHHQQALSIQRDLLPVDHLELATSLFQVGSVQGLLGDVTEGRKALEESLRIRRKHLGERHPAVAQPMTNLGVFLQNQGKLDEAAEVYEEVLSVMDEVMPSNPLARRVPLTNLSAIFSKRGDSERAADALQSYLQGFEDAGQQADELTRETFSCDIAVLRGDYEGAIRRCRRAVALGEELLGPDHRDVAYRLGKLGDALGRTGRVEEALAAFERSSTIYASRPEDGASAAIDLLNASYLELERDRVDAALALVERAREAVPEHRDPPERYRWLDSEIDMTLAALRVERDGDRPESLATLREVVGRIEAETGGNPGTVVYGLTALAAAERRAGNREEALAAAEKAVALADGAPVHSPGLGVRARIELARCIWATSGAEARARALALAAREELQPSDGFVQRERARLDDWLRARGWLDRDPSEP